MTKRAIVEEAISLTRRRYAYCADVASMIRDYSAPGLCKYAYLKRHGRTSYAIYLEFRPPHLPVSLHVSHHSVPSHYFMAGHPEDLSGATHLWRMDISRSTPRRVGFWYMANPADLTSWFLVPEFDLNGPARMATTNEPLGDVRILGSPFLLSYPDATSHYTYPQRAWYKRVSDRWLSSQDATDAEQYFPQAVANYAWCTKLALTPRTSVLIRPPKEHLSAQVCNLFDNHYLLKINSETDGWITVLAPVDEPNSWEEFALPANCPSGKERYSYELLTAGEFTYWT